MELPGRDVILKKFRAKDRIGGQYIFVTLTSKRIDDQDDLLQNSVDIILDELEKDYLFLYALIVEKTHSHCHIFIHGDMEKIKKIIKENNWLYSWTVFCELSYAENQRDKPAEFNRFLKSAIKYIYKQEKRHPDSDLIVVGYSN